MFEKQTGSQDRDMKIISLYKNTGIMAVYSYGLKQVYIIKVTKQIHSICYHDNGAIVSCILLLREENDSLSDRSCLAQELWVPIQFSELIAVNRQVIRMILFPILSIVANGRQFPHRYVAFLAGKAGEISFG